MYRAGDQFLPGSGFPVDEDGGICGRHCFDPLQNVAHLLTLEDDLPKFQLAADLIFQIQLLLGESILERVHFAERHCVFNRGRHMAGDLSEKRDFILRECAPAVRSQCDHAHIPAVAFNGTNARD